jgi:hypothetical protein
MASLIDTKHKHNKKRDEQFMHISPIKISKRQEKKQNFAPPNL